MTPTAELPPTATPVPEVDAGRRLADAVTTHYAVDVRAIARIAKGMGTTNWRVGTSAGDCFLKQYPPDADVAGEAAALDLSQEARAAGVPAPRVIPSATGELLQSEGGLTFALLEYFPTPLRVARCRARRWRRPAARSAGCTPSCGAGPPSPTRRRHGSRSTRSGNRRPSRGLPFLDANNGGSGVDIADTLQAAHDTIRGVDTIITGHSRQMTWADLYEFAAFNRDFLAAVRAGRAAGRTVDQIAGAWTMPAGYEGYRAPRPAGLRNSIQVIVDELEGNGFTPAASRKAAMARTAPRLVSGATSAGFQNNCASASRGVMTGIGERAKSRTFLVTMWRAPQARAAATCIASSKSAIGSDTA